MAVIDIIFIVIISIFALYCGVRGFVTAVMSLAAAILGSLSAIFLFRAGAEFLRESFMGDIRILPEILAFIVIFFIVFGIIKLLQIMLNKIIEGISLGGLDRVLGFIFGIAQGLIAICLLIFLLSIQPFFDPDPILGESFFVELLLPFIIGTQRDIADMIAGGVSPAGGGHV